MPEESLVFTDGEGHYYFHADEKTTWGGKADLNTGEGLYKDFPELAGKLDAASRLTSFDSADRLVTTLPVVLANEGRRLGTIINVAEHGVVFAPVRQFVWAFVALALVALVLTGAFSVWLSGTISRPVVKLTEEVERLSRGDLDSPIDVRSSDEIGELSHAIERLRKSLQILMKRAK
ncbi:MAG: HAMP domain-containing protein [Betaproteobacteria bacterium]|nr:HAMP domain-containing protein [Betaproteobacteria bacterium]